ncbi:MAG: integrase [Bacteroidetes bacterium HGW-Bacteroidetes-18]|nr:MAG: integrase [Bacteroidetes bacterium HGW-Bacteroidetes-18]
MATVNFLYRSTKNESNLTIRLLFRDKDKDFVFSAKTKIFVSSDYWHKQHPQKRLKDLELSNKQHLINDDLYTIESYVLNAFSAEHIDNISNNWFVNLMDRYYNPIIQKEISDKLVDFIEYYIDAKKNEVGPRSLLKFETIKNKVKILQNYLKKDLLIKDINESFKIDFLKFYEENNYSQNTAQKELAFIKTFCKYARYLGIETHPHLDKLRLEKAKTSHIYLSEKELEKIKNLADQPDYLDNARDWLLISCYTGQRVSDFLNFTKEKVRKSKGISMIEFTQQKTKKVMTVPLHPEVLRILTKRDGEFPRPISDQKYNKYIKTVCKDAGITQKVMGGKQGDINESESDDKQDGKKVKIFRKIIGTFEKYELVTSHIGRRSFATNNYGKIPTPLLIYATGHSTEAMFLKYIGKNDQDNALELAKYFNYE